MAHTAQGRTWPGLEAPPPPSGSRRARTRSLRLAAPLPSGRARSPVVFMGLLGACGAGLVGRRLLLFRGSRPLTPNPSPPGGEGGKDWLPSPPGGEGLGVRGG